MPKYVRPATGEIVYPDQLRSGEVTDAIQVSRYPDRLGQYPEEPRTTVPQRHVPETPQRNKRAEQVQINPFGNWLIGAHALLALAIIAGLAGGKVLSDTLEATGLGTFVLVVGAGLTSALVTVPLYLGIHIGSVLWESKQELLRLDHAFTRQAERQLTHSPAEKQGEL